MFSNNKLAKAVRLALVLGAGTSAAIASNAAIAQEENTEEVERIEVTGSRIKRTDMETSSPVQITSAEDIKVTGFTRIEDVLNTLPQVEAAETSFLSNGATGNATLDLRGLGSNRTLVLVNGRRLQPGGINSQAPDVNQIPAALVERVEVMTGGGSSTYGADAVAGVVNFVMNTDFEGIELNVGAGGYQHNNDNGYVQGLLDERNFEYETGNSGIGGKAYNIDLTMGSDFADGKGHATAYATWRRNDEMLQGERDYGSCALNGAGTACGGSANTIVPHFDMFPIYDGEVDYSVEYWGELDPNSDRFIPDTGTRYNYAPINHFMRPNERFSFGTFVDYEVNETNVYLELSYMHDRTAGQIAESGTFFNDEYVLDYNNPYMTDGQKAQLQEFFGQGPNDQFVAYIGKRNVEGGPRADNLEHSSYRIVFGAEGDLTDTWSYDVNFQYGSTSSSSAYINDLLAQNIFSRIGAVGSEPCEGDCIPYQIFTYNGVTSEQAAQLSGTAIQNGLVTQMVFSGFATGELDFALPSANDPIAAVVGFERREVDYERLSDTVYAEGQLLGQGGPSPSLFGGYDVSEIFGELSVPLYEGDNDQYLLLELGGRWSDYSTSGSDFVYKAAVDFTPVDGWKVRASYNRAVRAPNVNELFRTQSIGLWTGEDNCAGDSPAYSEAQCANTGLSSAQYGNITTSPAGQYNQFFGGNPDLEPEEADTLTVGVVAAPLDGFNFSIDYFDIQMEKVIGTVGAQRILQNCAETGDARFCDNVTRSPSGSLWLGQQGFITNLTDNVGSRHWRGVDLSANYAMDMENGTLNFALNGSYSLKKEYEPITGLTELAYDCSGNISVDCFAQPKWRHTFTTSYSTDDWGITAKWRFYGEVDYVGETDTLVADGIDSYNFFDLAGTYFVTENLSMRLAVNNVLDEEPPMVGNTLSTNSNTVAGFYDTLGRYMHLSASFKF